jgi:hypothetical protein
VPTSLLLQGQGNDLDALELAAGDPEDLDGAGEDVAGLVEVVSVGSPFEVNVTAGTRGLQGLLDPFSARPELGARRAGDLPQLVADLGGVAGLGSPPPGR